MAFSLPIERLEVVLWDFDGVLMDSNHVRDMGFKAVLEAYPKHQVQALIAFHKENGGLSRYVKFRYFFEQIRQEPLSDELLNSLCKSFSAIMREILLDEKLLISETLDFVSRHFTRLPMHIVSGSDQEELRHLCQCHGIDKYFRSISGSPTPKVSLVQNLLQENGYDPTRCVLVGDSINDYTAARDNGIHFLAYNNHDLERYNTIP